MSQMRKYSDKKYDLKLTIWSLREPTIRVAYLNIQQQQKTVLKTKVECDYDVWVRLLCRWYVDNVYVCLIVSCTCAAELPQRLTCISKKNNCRLFVVPIRLHCDTHTHTPAQFPPINFKQNKIMENSNLFLLLSPLPPLRLVVLLLLFDYCCVNSLTSGTKCFIKTTRACDDSTLS